MDNQDPELEKIIQDYYSTNFKFSQNIYSIGKLKLMNKIHRHNKYKLTMKMLYATISVAMILTISLVLLSEYSQNADIEEHIDIIE